MAERILFLSFFQKGTPVSVTESYLVVERMQPPPQRSKHFPDRKRTMKTLLGTSAALATFVCLGAANAQADSYYGHNHGGHNHVGHNHAATTWYPAPTHVHTHRPRPVAVWHDTTHVDVTPGRWVYGPYGLTYVPPQRRLHVDGHYDVVDTHDHHHGHNHGYVPVRRHSHIVYP
jgi:hypothetical protein